MGDPKVADMYEDGGTLHTIGELARLTGVPVKTIRDWSDRGLLPPAARTPAGYRLYGPDAPARLEIVRTLRELGIGTAGIRAVLQRERSVAELAAHWADALDAQIRTLQLRRAVLRSVAERGSAAEELPHMNKLARLSAEERRRTVQEFIEDTLAGVDAPAYRGGLLALVPELPDDPTPDQITAWLDLAEHVRSPGLRGALRRMAEFSADVDVANTQAPDVRVDDAHAADAHAADVGASGARAAADAHTADVRASDPRAAADVDTANAHTPDAHAATQVAELMRERAEAALAAGLAPDSPAAEPVVAELVAAWIPTQRTLPDPPAADGPEARARLLEQLERATEPEVERYWRLFCAATGRPAPPEWGRAGAWTAAALRAHPAPGALDLTLDVSDLPDAARVLSAYETVAEEVGALVATVASEDLARPTPCPEWSVRQLIGHMVWENLMVTSIAQDAPRTDHTADHLGDDHVTAFRDSARAALAVFRSAGVQERTYGPYEAPGALLVQQATVELLAHGWDLARALDADTDLAAGVAPDVLEAAHRIYGAAPRTEGGSFAPARPTTTSASGADRLAAYLGREVDRPVG
ncbi:TIGR03086 family metal-binding protein [Streptomyces sp. NPDC003077]|uniref:TIGR03086 family metal-binding protein n=1 Tax=Streptomyces sp. NPDC003077 TaxID=3154443 RepID=UPI0033A35EDF